MLGYALVASQLSRLQLMTGSSFSRLHDRPSEGRSCLEPFERTRAEIEFVSGFLVGGATQARRVIDVVGAGSRQSFRLGDLKRFRRTASACERRQPYALLARVVVNNVVDARSTFERRDCSGCRVLDMDETRHALAGADDRHLLAAHLLGHITSVSVPGAWSVKESVTHRNAVYFRCAKGSRFEFNVGASAGGD